MYKIGDIGVLQCAPLSLDSPSAQYHGCNPGTVILPKGHRKDSNHVEFAADTILERDIEIPLRDGTILRADVYRPKDFDGKVPALMAWSPYGKSGQGFLSLDLIPGRVGVPQNKLSGFESFEAPDPAEWTSRGYAIVNVDIRGVFNSTGDIRWFGTADGQDGYDAIEHVAQLDWCTGKVALVGNSWLAATQWSIAAEQPPHLACIAPLEGVSDFYRETLCRGGVPYTPFWGFLGSHVLFGKGFALKSGGSFDANCWMAGRNQQEDVVGMIGRYPLMNEYWEDKRAKIEDIQVPAYVLASYSSGLHTVGSFRGFEDIPHQKKWLRVHPTFEWYDLYTPEMNNDLQLFFDRFAKGIQNSWEKTPRVRVSTLNFHKEPEVNHAFNDWPVPSAQPQMLYLCAGGNLNENPSPSTLMLSYQSDISGMQMDTDTEELQFVYTFQRRSHLIGYSKVVLYMSCNDHDDMDVFVQLRKADSTGKILQNINIPLSDLKMQSSEVETINCLKYLGPTGILRASHRKLDSRLSKPYWPVHAHDQEERVKPGEIVQLEIGLWPTGIVFDEGEKLVLKIAGHHMALAEFVPLRGTFKAGNKGRHNVHMSPEHQSHVIFPIVHI
ncbi:hypothetical protein N7509_000440 [Penicillium cosmopolitanum]|uniref:Xaa-Pro dipeptidyl-peptidase C-terminal domain-containing protein n=1 Tax=Penicillium cosmopolitanum TaxID=1131564 RepID=A0A9W9WAL2_9EURO|nr:uncharacterized protein N7509_000440 [Penicillium cosmopolitanum]KAJ5413813.1 hypothetical protein N7509_000440 [Penicillium cosmopolitanum]